MSKILLFLNKPTTRLQKSWWKLDTAIILFIKWIFSLFPPMFNNELWETLHSIQRTIELSYRKIKARSLGLFILFIFFLYEDIFIIYIRMYLHLQTYSRTTCKLQSYFTLKFWKQTDSLINLLFNTMKRIYIIAYFTIAIIF